MNTLSQYCSTGFLGLCLAIALSSCSPGGDDGAIKLKAAPTDAQLRSGNLAFTFLMAGLQPGRVLLPGWKAEATNAASGPSTKITKDSTRCAIGIPDNRGTTPRGNITFTWYNAQFTYYPPRTETSANNPGGNYDVWMNVHSVENTPIAQPPNNETRPTSGEYYFYFGSLWNEGNYSSTDPNAGGPGMATGKYQLEKPWQKTNQTP